MITKDDLREAIAECQGVRNPTANTAIKLAAFLTIQRELYGEEPPAVTYSFAEPPDKDQYSGVESVGNYGSSDFLMAIQGKDPGTVWRVMDELMDTLKMVNERVYNSTMRKIR